jgi:ribose/xylose/arabinose/galactoside ABC-type transport system permease subunit
MSMEGSMGSSSSISREKGIGKIWDTFKVPIIFIIVAIVMNFIVQGDLLTGENIIIILVNCVPNVFVAWGISYIWSSGPDFSAAAAMVLSAQVGGILATEFNAGYLGLFGGCIAVCIGLQVLSTSVRLKLGMQPWVIGIAICLIYESFGIMYSTACAATGHQTVTLPANVFTGVTQMPWILIILAAGVAFMYILNSKTQFGINYRAVSCNEFVAEHMGIKRKKTILIGVAVGAVMLGISGTLTMSLSSRMPPSSNLGSFAAISKGLCAWLLSAAMDKKINPPIAILISSIFISVIFNFLTRMGVPQGTWLDTLLGVIIVIFLCIAAVAERKEAME